jgi:hypothetical protein
VSILRHMEWSSHSHPILTAQDAFLSCILCKEEEWNLIWGENSGLDAIPEQGTAQNGECDFCDVSVC